MTTYTAITETETDPDAPGTSSLWKRWWKNPLAMFEGAAGAPRLMGAAHPTFAAGAVDLIYIYGPAVAFYESFSSGATASGTVYTTEFKFCAMNAGGLRASVNMNKGTGNSSVMRVVRNGIVLATVTNITTTYGVQTIDFTFAQYDVVELQCGLSYSMGSGGGNAVANFQNLKMQADQVGVFRT